MRKKIGEALKSRLGRILVLLLLVAVVIVATRFLFFKPAPPSLADVLNQESKGSFDLSLIILSLVGCSLAALSLAKSYEIVRRKRPVAEAFIPKVMEEDNSENLAEEMENNRQIEELMQSKRAMLDQNGELQSQLKVYSSEIDELKRIEQMLRKSNIALGKDCERIKLDNEELTLKVNVVKLPTVTLAKSEVKVLKSKKLKPAIKKKTKTKAKAKVKTKKKVKRKTKK
jgi:hypothetical protein